MVHCFFFIVIMMESSAVNARYVKKENNLGTCILHMFESVTHIHITWKFIILA